MEMPRNIEVCYHTRIIATDENVIVRVEAVLTTEVNPVTVMEAEYPLVDFEIREERFLHHPVELRIAARHVVVHVPLQGVTRPRVPVLLHAHTAMIAIFGDDGDAREVAVLLQVLQPSFDDILGDDRLIHRRCGIVRLNHVHVERAVDEVSPEEQHQLGDGHVLTLLVGEPDHSLEERRCTLSRDGDIVLVDPIGLRQRDRVADVEVGEQRYGGRFRRFAASLGFNFKTGVTTIQSPCGSKFSLKVLNCFNCFLEIVGRRMVLLLLTLLSAMLLEIAHVSSPLEVRP